MREVSLTFVLDEDVTPDIFAERVARACQAGYALRPGEAILLPSDSLWRFIVHDGFTALGSSELHEGRRHVG